MIDLLTDIDERPFVPCDFDFKYTDVDYSVYPKAIGDYLKILRHQEFALCKEQLLLHDFIIDCLNDPNVLIDNTVITDAIDFMERLFFPLYPAQKALVALMCLYRKDDGEAYFNEILLKQGRGGGKTGLGAALSLYFLSHLHNVKNYDIDVIGNSESQAKTIPYDIRAYIDTLPKAKAKRIFKYNYEVINYRMTNSSIRYRTSSSKTADGRRPGMIIFDEVHSYVNYDNLTTNLSGLGKVKHARTLYITSEGHIRDGVIDFLTEKGELILRGQRHNGFLPFIFKLDSLDEINKPNYWVKAVPRLQYSASLRSTMINQYETMLVKSELRREFITKRMGIRYEVQDESVAVWDDILATRERDWIDLTDYPAIGAVDFADLRDFAAVGLRWKVNGITYFKQHTFIHQSSIKMTKFNIDIMEAVNQGFATIVPDAYPTIPPSMIVDWFNKQSEKYYIKRIQADKFRFTALRDEFLKYNIPLVAVRSGYVTHSLLAPLVVQMFSNRTLVLEDDKLMRWYINNTALKTDAKGNQSFLKKEPIKRKTDGFFCFIHSLVNDDLEEATSLQDNFDLIVL